MRILRRWSATLALSRARRCEKVCVSLLNGIRNSIIANFIIKYPFFDGYVAISLLNFNFIKLMVGIFCEHIDMILLEVVLLKIRILFALFEELGLTKYNRLVAECGYSGNYSVVQRYVKKICEHVSSKASLELIWAQGTVQ